MTVSALSAAKELCRESDWTLSNLALQKILYLAHMVYMGRHDGNRLIAEPFEAWDYGPVSPATYHRTKAFGSSPIKNIFHFIDDLEDGDELSVLKEAAEHLKNKSPSHLVCVTHDIKGAWSKIYKPGLSPEIPDSAIMDEYRARNNV